MDEKTKKRVEAVSLILGAVLTFTGIIAWLTGAINFPELLDKIGGDSPTDSDLVHGSWAVVTCEPQFVQVGESWKNNEEPQHVG